MKIFKFLAVAALLALGTNAQAQKEWEYMYLQLNPSTMEPNKGDNESFTGLSFGYNKSFSLVNDMPVFIEVGAGLQYSFKTKDLDADDLGLSQSQYAQLLQDADPKYKYNGLSLKVPVNFVYDWKVSDNVNLMPFVGLTFRYNITGNMNFSWNLSNDLENKLKQNYSTTKDFEEAYGDKDVNLFDKKDMGSSENTWNRFQIGYQIGVNMRVKDQFIVGVSYGNDFSEISKKVKVSTTSLTLGYCF